MPDDTFDISVLEILPQSARTKLTMERLACLRTISGQSRRIEELETRLRTLCESLEERAALIDGRTAEGRQLAIALREAREVLK